MKKSVSQMLSQIDWNSVERNDIEYILESSIRYDIPLAHSSDAHHALSSFFNNDSLSTSLYAFKNSTQFDGLCRALHEFLIKDISILFNEKIINEFKSKFNSKPIVNNVAARYSDCIPLMLCLNKIDVSDLHNLKTYKNYDKLYASVIDKHIKRLCSMANLVFTYNTFSYYYHLPPAFKHTVSDFNKSNKLCPKYALDTVNDLKQIFTLDTIKNDIIKNRYISKSDVYNVVNFFEINENDISDELSSKEFVHGTPFTGANLVAFAKKYTTTFKPIVPKHLEKLTKTSWSEMFKMYPELKNNEEYFMYILSTGKGKRKTNE
ncbi:structural protein [Pseudomonas phage vB_PaeM_PA5oct]|uniref:Structural protein n=1 Tax=Pseudomonas phage vB_PaeM_PA5oct TaxID=2163605 RepID=A0A4Y5JW62_9CAUD|nr:structural protein [Pseudomonas phage vB_PaeM_PA5oct]QCG76232.1 structural protein [Pseudomonas phage vB_PaeM_PA5oct]